MRDIISEDKALHPDTRRDRADQIFELHRLAVIIDVDHSANRKARPITCRRKRRIKMFAANIVKIDVNPFGCSVEELGEDGASLVVNAFVSAEFLNPSAFIGPACGANHCHALLLGNLNHGHANRASGSRDKDDITCFGLSGFEQAEIGRRPG